ncbi:MAG: hypothetical protein GVY12_11640 [Bacteroidetes bacterium]|jgi:hypothetical protein|nr:hypothetical protein [Bacteroidota bacterium]
MRIVATVLVIALLAGCSSDQAASEHDQHEQEAGLQIHPQTERFPHAHTAAIRTGDADSCDLSGSASPVERLRTDLDAEHEVEVQRIPVNVPESQHVRLAPLGEDLVLILTTRPGLEELSAYHLPTDSTFQVADSGQGPGELLFPTDLAVHGNEAYVSMGDRRIATFTCEQSSCTHENDVGTDFQPTSLSAHSGQFTAMGTLPLRGETALSSLEGALHRVDASGTVVDSFGESYQTEAWMVNERFTRQGSHTGFSDGAFAVHYDLIPRVYLYGRDGALTDVVEITEFEQGTFTYENGHRSMVQEDTFSRIGQLHAIRDDLLYFTVTTGRGSASQSENAEVDLTYDHYVAGTSPTCVSLIGTESITGESGHTWVPTDHHLLRIKDGTVYLVGQPD